MGCHKSNDPGEVLNYLFNFSYLQGLGNWDIFSLDINHAYWEPGVGMAIEFINNTISHLGVHEPRYGRRGSCSVDKGGNFPLCWQM